MELRRNIIFSLIAHISIALTILSLAGRNAALSRFEDYIAVSLLEDTSGSGPARGDRMTENRNGKRERVTKTPPSDSIKRMAPVSEKVSSSERPEDDPLNDGKSLTDVLNPGAGRGQTPDKASEQSSPVQQGLGFGKGPASALAASQSARQTAVQAGGMEVTMTGPRPAGGRGDLLSPLDMIRAAIERAKIYPVLARRGKLQGTVFTEFSINEKGQPENVRVVKSSGFSVLDSAARDTIFRAAPFPVVKGTMEVPIRFTLRQQDSFDVK